MKEILNDFPNFKNNICSHKKICKKKCRDISSHKDKEEVRENSNNIWLKL